MPRTLLTTEQKRANKRAANRRWAASNPGRRKAIRQKYEAANKEKIAESRARARKLDPEKFRARSRQWRIKNPEKSHEHSAKRYREQKDAFRAQITAWREANPERFKAIAAASRKRPGSAQKRREYANKRHATNVQARLATLLRNRVLKALKGRVRSASVLSVIGCSLGDLVAHLEGQFIDGMTWANHGEWHIDHRRPLSSFDLTDPDQYASACHFTNLQPLWGRENQSKGSRYDKGAVAKPAEHRVD